MSEIAVPIGVFPWPVSPERQELLKTARGSQNVIFVPGVYGAYGRILAFERPNFLCHYAPIRPENHDNVQSIQAALAYILAEDVQNPEERWDAESLLFDWAGMTYSHSEELDTGKVVFS